jgi:DNA-binding PadR family transcriptional regulator
MTSLSGATFGRERKYYALTADGRRALRDEARRLKGAAKLAERRLKTAGGRS